MSKAFTTGVLVFLFSFTCQTISATAANIAQWDRNSAMASVHSVDIDVAVREVGDISSLSDGADTLKKLVALETRSDWPLPAREAAVHQFTRSLAALPRDAVAVEVIQHLRSYQPQVLIPDEDHSQALVPMFNIRAAAAGVENGWLRKESAAFANSLILTKPADLVSSFAATSSHNRRSGYLDALQQADFTDVKMVQNAALQQLESKPELSAVVAVTAVITGDEAAVHRLLLDGRGAGLSSAFVALEEQLSVSETAEFLAFAVDHAPASNTSLLIAAWWPRLSHHSSTRDLMLSLLEDPNLGADAALALSKSPDLQTIKALQDYADGDSNSARRAQMALDLNRSQLTGGSRP